MRRVLVVDDEENLRLLVRTILRREGFEVEVAAGGEQALALVESFGPDVILTDVRMPKMGGLDLLTTLKAKGNDAVVVVMSAYGNVDLALEAMKAGAYDYLQKPFKPEELVLVLRKAEERESLRRENRALRQEMRQKDMFEEILAKSAEMQAIFKTITKIADYKTTALVVGESGVGKELGARSIHGLSARRSLAFIARNASTMPETLLDAELFGNAKNYPNAGMPERPGLIGEADGSTLFLDEIGDLPEKSQVHLLRVLDSEGEYQRLGESKPRRSALKLVAATNRAPESLKHDFLARFVHRIEIPGLTQRREDIPLVAAHILRGIAAKNAVIASRFFERRADAIAEARIQPELIARLLRHPFTHHVRELERILWLAIGTATADFIGITPEVEGELRDSAESAAETSEVDRDTLARALADNDRSPTKTAKALGLKNRYVLIRLLKKHGLSAGAEGSTEDR